MQKGTPKSQVRIHTFTIRIWFLHINVLLFKIIKKKEYRFKIMIYLRRKFWNKFLDKCSFFEKAIDHTPLSVDNKNMAYISCRLAINESYQKRYSYYFGYRIRINDR